MNERTLSNALDHHDVKELHHLWHHCARIGTPLNVFVTVRPHNADTLAIDALCAIFDRIKDLYGSFARRHGFEPTHVWTRETLLNNTADHLHLLCHVPPKWRKRFITRVFGWLPGRNEIDARNASQHVEWTPSGKCKSSIGYASKNMTPQAAFKSTRIRKKGGKVLGQRWGCSRNLEAARVLV